MLSKDNVRQRFLAVLVEREKKRHRDDAFETSLREVLGPRAQDFSESLRSTLREFFERGVICGREETRLPAAVEIAWTHEMVPIPERSWFAEGDKRSVVP